MTCTWPFRDDHPPADRTIVGATFASQVPHAADRVVVRQEFMASMRGGKRKWRATVLSGVSATVAGVAHAVVTASGANVELPRGLDLGGVGALSNGCSSALLSGGSWLLGAAHCAGSVGSTVTFSSGATASIVDVVFAPGWLPDTRVAVDDLVLMRLAAPLTGLPGYAVGAPPPIGSAAIVAGYGAGGSGISGATLPAGTLRYGRNEYEYILPDTDSAAYRGRVVAFDFDDGSAASNRFGSRGLGAGEAMLAPLDSGGPSFIMTGGVWRIAGIHVGIAQDYGSTFGGVGFDIQPGYYGGWIGQVTAVNEPEAGV
jgi:hypothetical protein